MIRAARTGFAWEAAPGEPFVDIRWDYRRGAAFTRRAIAWARIATIPMAVGLWVLILHGCGGPN
jgi:hypothetical protein